MLKKIFLGLGLVLVIIVVFCVNAFRPTPEFMRNNTVDGVKVDVRLSTDKRIPIVKTFTQEEFSKKDEADFEKLNDFLNGRIEGDIPTIHLEEDKNIYLLFNKDGKVIEPDETPKITIVSKPSYLDVQDGERVIEGKLKKLDSGYVYEMNRYRTQFEKYFMESNLLTVNFAIDGEAFVTSFYAITNNAIEGTDFFENETLAEPIPAEI
ncbi:hypothetical protein [Peptoniphilus indolicus]|nr:hypothetical protein [Peptoniphilus indolicus]SUB75637.1 Uncharacterised protein [Peptoniphilus indolicus]